MRWRTAHHKARIALRLRVYREAKAFHEARVARLGVGHPKLKRSGYVLRHK